MAKAGICTREMYTGEPPGPSAKVAPCCTTSAAQGPVQALLLLVFATSVTTSTMAAPNLAKTLSFHGAVWYRGKSTRALSVSAKPGFHCSLFGSANFQSFSVDVKPFHGPPNQANGMPRLDNLEIASSTMAPEKPSSSN
eukprot:UN3883